MTFLIISYKVTTTTTIDLEHT